MIKQSGVQNGKHEIFIMNLSKRTQIFHYDRYGLMMLKVFFRSTQLSMVLNSAKRLTQSAQLQLD